MGIGTLICERWPSAARSRVAKERTGISGLAPAVANHSVKYLGIDDASTVSRVPGRFLATQGKAVVSGNARSGARSVLQNAARRKGPETRAPRAFPAPPPPRPHLGSGNLHSTLTALYRGAKKQQAKQNVKSVPKIVVKRVRYV